MSKFGSRLDFLLTNITYNYSHSSILAVPAIFVHSYVTGEYFTFDQNVNGVLICMIPLSKPFFEKK
jgi:putative flippase GtrA